jgi:NAD+ diphosphatase
MTSDNSYEFCPRCRSALATAPRGGRERRVCPAPDCGFVFWNNPIPIVASIVEREDGVVLVRSRGAPATWFGLVAGFLEPGERPLEGACREVLEEIGVEGIEPTFIDVQPFELRNQIIFTYHMRIPTTSITLCPQELDAYRIVPIDELIPWNRGTGPALSRWLATRGLHPTAVDFGSHIDA